MLPRLRRLSGGRPLSAGLFALIASRVGCRLGDDVRITLFYSNRTPASTAFLADLEGWRRQNPNFHLVLLGLGSNGHIASLFPNTSVLNEKSRWVSAVHINELKMNRVTFTAPFINQANQVVFLVSGNEKAEALRQTLAPASGERPTPASRVCPADGEIVWMVDRRAAARLPRAGAYVLEEAGS